MKKGDCIHSQAALRKNAKKIRFRTGLYKKVFILQIFALRSLRALPTTDTELKLIAAAAIIGLRRIPKNG